MFCVPISDETYRRAAELAGISDIDLAPVDDSEFAAKRADVDALLVNALFAGLEVLERDRVRNS